MAKQTTTANPSVIPTTNLLIAQS